MSRKPRHRRIRCPECQQQSPVFRETRSGWYVQCTAHACNVFAMFTQLQDQHEEVGGDT
jgi:hypothetical protein